jgi:hypothetical protein
MSALFLTVAGVPAELFPVIAERVAIDASTGLRGAEAGLRALRGRPLLRRLWDGVTGRGSELAAAVGQDLIAVQRATLAIVREVMREEARTQDCVARVLANLEAVNRDLDDTSGRVEALAGETAALRALVRLESVRLEEQVAAVRGEVHREACIRRLGDLYRAGELHPGAGDLLAAALYLVAADGQYAGAEPERRRQEARAAAAVVRQRLTSAPAPVEDALLAAAQGADHRLCEPLLYLAQGRGPCLAVLGGLAERRLAGLPCREVDAADAVAIARALRDPDTRLETRLVRPAELAGWIAGELDALPWSGSLSP